MAIEAEIKAMLRRDWPDAAIATRKKTIVPHSAEPPYFIIDAGKPAPSPKPRRARPETMIERQRQPRTNRIARAAGSRVKRLETAFNIPAARLRAGSRYRAPRMPNASRLSKQTVSWRRLQPDFPPAQDRANGPRYSSAGRRPQ